MLFYLLIIFTLFLVFFGGYVWGFYYGKQEERRWWVKAYKLLIKRFGKSNVDKVLTEFNLK